MHKSSVAVAISASITLALAACGGGGGDSGNQPVIMEPDTSETAPEPELTRLPFPLPGFTCPDHYGQGYDCDAYQPDTFDPDNVPTYNHDALPDRTREDDGLHMPVYHDHSQLFGIGVHDWGEHRRIFVGTDRGESVGRIPAAGARGATKLRYGTVADGVASTELQDFLTESLGTAARRYETAPTVNILGSPSANEVNWTVAAVELVNAALPVEARMRIGAASEHSITVEFRPYTEFASGTGATTWNTLNGDEIVASRIHVSSDAFGRGSHRHFTTLIAHELMHALGLDHVSERFDTLMEASREIYRAWQGYQVSTRIDPDFSCGVRYCFSPIHRDLAAIPMPMSLVYPLDREALQVLYTNLELGDDPADFGTWQSTSVHIAGNGQHANFGVALRNGIAEPWAHGYLPETDLADNRALAGTVTWSGALLGLTPAAEAVSGDASIGVDLATLTGTAAFTRLEVWAAREASGETGSGTKWLDGDLSYTIAVRGNTFRETGGDDGRLTGIFTGRSHEGAAGTLERTDLTAAFGASR